MKDLIKSKTPSVDSLSKHGIVTLGSIGEEIVKAWTVHTEGNTDVVLTVTQRTHYLERHPEMGQHENSLPDVLLDPDEVHRNKYDEDMAIFYRRLDAQHYLRVAVLIQTEPTELRHSVLSFRLANRQEVQRGKGRQVWKKK